MKKVRILLVTIQFIELYIEGILTKKDYRMVIEEL